jgi:predicted transcriptional regulator
MADARRLPPVSNLSRRERQIMDVIYAAGEASAAAVLAAMPDPPSYSAVRALLRILEEKGHLRHRSSGGKYVFIPVRPRDRAGKSALRRVLRTFFNNSAAKAVAALMDVADSELTDEELAELTQLVERAKRNQRRQA